MEFLFEVFEDLLKYINCEKVIIFHDNISLKNKNDFISNIKKFFKNKKIKSEFEINDSKLNFSLQLADLLLSKYKEKFLFEDILYLPDFILKKDLENKKI